MENIKLYEEFTGVTIPNEPDLAKEISELFDITEDFRKARIEKRSRFYSSLFRVYVPLSRNRISTIEKVKELIKLLKDNNYKIETFPVLSEMSLKAMTLQIRIDYSNPFKDLEYGITILVDCVHNGQKYKACINISSTGFSYEILGKRMEMIEAKIFDEYLIDMLFWNGEYLVTCKFRHDKTYREDGITLEFVSHETSDDKDYVMYVSATGSFNAGYELEDIQEIDFV